MNSFADVYRASLKADRLDVRKKLDSAMEAYNLLSNKDSECARSIKALYDIHVKVMDIYDESPKALGGDKCITA